MRLLPITRPSPEANLALDEALLLGAESGGGDTLRVWESPRPMVVLGRSSRIEQEVNLAACEGIGAPVLRRVTGGATIVCGPGCLMYAAAINTTNRPDLQVIENCHREVLSRLTTALRTIDATVQQAGTSDLAFRSSPDGPLRKFSGNSLRLTRNCMLYHGTLLYAFDLGLVTSLLRSPPRQPDYRGGRPHDAFIGNLPARRDELVAAVTRAWPQAIETTNLTDSEELETERLVTTRYGTDAWNRKL